MPLRPCTVLILTCLLAAVATTALAQATGPSRFSLGLSVGGQTLPSARTDTTAFELFAETGRLRGTQTIGPDVVYDGAAAMRLTGWLGVGVATSFLQGRETAAITSEVPNPFFFDFHRTVTSNVPGLLHRELAVHPQAQFWIPLSSSLRFTFALGPTMFDGTQDIVTGMTTTETGFPFDEVNVESHTTERISVTDVGYNVSFDLSYFGARGLGVGFLARYSRATPSFALDGSFHPGIELGGLHLAGGLRYQF